jgi:hypothetical protein
MELPNDSTGAFGVQQKRFGGIKQLQQIVVFINYLEKPDYYLSSFHIANRKVT